MAFPMIHAKNTATKLGDWTNGIQKYIGSHLIWLLRFNKFEFSEIKRFERKIGELWACEAFSFINSFRAFFFVFCELKLCDEGSKDTQLHLILDAPHEMNCFFKRNYTHTNTLSLFIALDEPSSRISSSLGLLGVINFMPFHPAHI